MSDWEPIETAPKDGTLIDIWVKWWVPEKDIFTGARWPDVSWSKGEFTNSAETWRSRHDRFVGKMTHWMPAPKPPEKF